jgi:hypothetical protein
MEPENSHTRRIAVPVQEERPSKCLHVHRRLSRCLRQPRSPQCSGWTRRPSRDGPRPGSSHLSGPSVVIAGIGKQRFVPCWRASPSSARNDTWPFPDAHHVRKADAASRASACGEAQLVRGGRPRRSGRRTGGRGSREMQSINQRTEPGSIRPPRASGRTRPGDHQQQRPEAVSGNGRRPSAATAPGSHRDRVRK